MEPMKEIENLVSMRFESPVSPDGQWWYLIQARAMVRGPSGDFEWNWRSSWVQGFDHEIDMDEATALAVEMLKGASFSRYFVQVCGISLIFAPKLSVDI